MRSEPEIASIPDSAFQVAFVHKDLLERRATLANEDADALDVRSAALDLAVYAEPTDDVTVDALVDCYKRCDANAFLAPALLEALGLFAERSSIARAELQRLLVRIPLGLEADPDERYRFIAAAKAIGRVDALAAVDDVRDLLHRWADASDALLQAEARMQLASIELCDAFGAGDRDELLRRLGEARAAFERTAASEEHRPDATLFVVMLDAVLAFARAPLSAGTVSGVLDRVATARRMWIGNGLASDRGLRVAVRLSLIVSTLQRMQTLSAEADRWIRFDDSVRELATLVAEWRSYAAPTGVERALAKLADQPVVPALGPLLASNVSSLRMDHAVRTLESDGTPHDVIEIAKIIARGLAGEAAAGEVLRSGPAARLAEYAARLGQSPLTFLSEFLDATDRHDTGYLARTLPRLAANPLDHPAPYSGYPLVDVAAREIAAKVHHVVTPYDGKKWERFVETLVMLLNHVQELRDTLPDFILCAANGGLGQTASEQNLQDSIYRHLREKIGYGAVYEGSRLAGGRPDSGALFEECRFPIEVKAEFSDVGNSHVRAAYLAQADAYAANADQIAFVVVLDLRQQNADGYTKSRNAPQARSLYSLHQGAWVDVLPTDPCLGEARPNAIVVLLVPGNRPRPSSMTKYSHRPAGARAPRGKKGAST